MPPLVDAYLRQAIPLFQTYSKDLHKLANKKLVVYTRNVEAYHFMRIEVQIPVEIKFVPVHKDERPVTRDNIERNKNTYEFVQNLQTVHYVRLYNARVKDVVMRALQAEKEIQNKESTLSRKITKLSELKDGLEHFSEIVERIYEFYSAKSLDFLPKVDLPLLDDIKKAKEAIHALKKKLAVGELSKWINKYCVEELSTSDDAIICTILGLSEDNSSWLTALDPWIYNHEPILYFIEKSIDVAQQERKDAGLNNGKLYLLNSLQSFGFTLNTTSTICGNIEDDIVDLQTPSFWGKRYLNYAYTFHPLLRTCPRYPYNETTVDNWFTIDLPQHELSEKAGEPVGVHMINLSDNHKMIEEIKAKLKNLQTSGDEYQLLFHGTTHDNALSIITHGIILTKGAQNQDFSSGDGFYLSEDYDNASVWGSAGRGGHQAVIVYKIKRTLLDTREHNGLDLTRDGELWEKIVLCCRSGYREKKLKKSFSGYNFIRGPMCRNPKQLSCIRPQGFGRGDMQLCIRDEDYAEDFGSLQNIGCVVFY